MKKTITKNFSLLAWCILLWVYPSAAHAFSGSGAGTEAHPYIITTAMQLDEVRNDLTAHYKLGSDINLGVAPWNSAQRWLPIGSQDEAFLGSLDGNDKEISGLSILAKGEREYSIMVGLFAWIGESGKVKNISVSGSLEVFFDGQIKNNLGLIAGKNDGEIRNFSVDADINILYEANSGMYRIRALGGVCGWNTALISDGIVRTKVTCHSPAQDGSIWMESLTHVGGVVGLNNTENAQVIFVNSVVEFQVVQGGANNLGGFVGFNSGGLIDSCSVSGSIALTTPAGSHVGGFGGNTTGLIRNSSANVNLLINHTLNEPNWSGVSRLYGFGGFLGNAYSGATTEYSEFVGAFYMRGGEGVGGFVGDADGNSSFLGCSASALLVSEIRNYPPGAYDGGTDSGGFAGYIDGVTISECAASGSVNGVSNTGGFVGRAANSTLTDNYTHADVTSASNGGGFVGTSSNTTFTNCYSSNDISGTSSSFVSTSSGDAFISTYWNSSKNSVGVNGGVTPLSANAFSHESNLNGWDFDTVWVMQDGMPHLQVIEFGPPPVPEFYAWSKIGNLDLWSSFDDFLHDPLGSSFVSSSALAITVSENGTPLTDKQQIADLAVAMQAKLVAQELGSWDHSFIQDGDVFQLTTQTGSATTGFNPSGFVLATPSTSNQYNSDYWSEDPPGLADFIWVDQTLLNAPFEIAIPSDGTGTLPPDFTSALNTEWSTASGKWINPGVRRRIYADVFSFAAFPESGTFSDVSDELRSNFLASFTAANDAFPLGQPMTNSVVADYMDAAKSALSSNETELFAALTDYAAGFRNSAIIHVGGVVVNATEDHRVVCELLLIKAINQSKIRKRLAYLEDFTGTVPWYTYPGRLYNDPLQGWKNDPAILYGFYDAKDALAAILSAETSSQMSDSILGNSDIWGGASEEIAWTGIRSVSEVVVSEALALLPTPYAVVYRLYQAAMLMKKVHDFARSELDDSAEKIQIMYAAGSIDKLIGIRGQKPDANSLENIHVLQTRCNIRMLLATLYYGSLGLEDDNIFYGKLSSEYQAHLTQRYSDMKKYIQNDYQMTNPVSAVDAAALAQAAYVADSVPGIINPQGQFNLTVESGVGGTANGGGFKNENSQASITASADGGYRFGSWSGLGISDTTNPITTVLMDSDKTVTASFLKEWTVSVAANPTLGGSAFGGGIGVAGETVPISANVNSGYRFGGWSGASGIADPSSLSTTITTDTDKTVTASFVKQWQLTLINGNPSRGSVSGAGLLDEGTVPITASPGPGYRFGGWSGLGVADPHDPTTSAMLNQDRSITAHFLINSTDGYNAYSSIFGGETDIERIGPNKDFDGDLKTNFYEYVFGLDPTSPINEPDNAVSTFQRGENMHGRLIFKPRSDDNEITYKVWVSGDLSNWSPITLNYSAGAWSTANPAALTVEAQTDHGDGTWSVTVEDKIPVSAGSPRFMKVSAESPYNN